MQKTLVTIEQKQLARVLGTMGSVINSKSTLPILADVILSYDKERKVFQLAASDTENWLYIDCVDPQTGEPWIKLIEDAPKDPFTSVAINLRQLKEATGQLPSACVLQVTFTGNDHVMNIVHQTGHMSMPWEDADAFPQAIPAMTPERRDRGEKGAGSGDPVLRFTMQTDRLLQPMKQAATCAGSDELRPVMNGVALDCYVDKMVIVSSDGHTLYKRTLGDLGVGWLDYQEFVATGSAIVLVPKQVLKIAATAFQGREQVTLTVDTQRMEWQSGGICLVSRTIEGRYPNYNSVIPQQNPHRIEIDRLAMRSSLRRISPFASDSSQLGTLRRDGDHLMLSAQDIDFSRAAEEQVTLLNAGDTTLPDGFEIGFKLTTMLSLLDLAETDNVILHVADPSRAMLLTEEDKNSSLTLLLMPMLING